MLFQIDGKTLCQQTLNSSSCFRIAKLLFRLAFKLRFTDLDGDDRRKTFTDIISGQILLTVLENLP